MKSIFVSCVYEDSKYIKNLQKFGEKGLLVNFVFTDYTNDQREKGTKAIEDDIRNKIRGAAVLLLLVGNDTHNKPWIRREIKNAISFNKKIICVRVPNTTGARPRELKAYKEISLDPNAIRKALE